ncbi:MAG: type VI secretion protein IcmF/TssM N-terminal domain-containing protein, partial [Pseudomonadota bacterium]
MNVIGTSFEKILPVLPYVIAGLIILIILVAVFLFLILRGAKKQPPPVMPKEPQIDLDQVPEEAEGKDETRAERLRFPVLNLRRSFTKAIGLLRANVSGRGYRYRIPWFLMMGEAGAGKTTALDNTGTNLAIGKALVERLRGTQACNWWFFDKGVVLDVAGDMVLREDGKTSDEKTWRTLLRLLQKYRPERPIDGVILTIPCRDLLGSEEQAVRVLDKAVQKASVLYEKLWDIQRKLGLRFPLYILVTKCDLIGGFQSFSRAIPERLRTHIFGWSAPFAVDTSYSADWVTEAFRTLNKELYQTQMGAFTEGVDPQESDGLFLFPAHFKAIAEPLQAYLDRIFRESAYHESFILRGLYFCGDSGTDPFETTRKRPSFLKDLFERKIFPEFGLARPVMKQFISRNRAVLVAQGLALFIALFWGLGLWWSCRSIQEDKKRLIPVLENIDNDLRIIKDRRRIDPAFFHKESRNLLEGMGRTRLSDLNYFFIPSSWFADIKTNIEDAVAIAYDKIMMKSLHIELNNRVKRIISSGGTTRTIPKAVKKTPEPVLNEETPEFTALHRYVEEVREFEKHAAMYDHLRTAVGEEAANALAQVVKYLFGTELPRDFFQFAKQYEKPLGSARGEPLNLMPYKQDATTKAERLIQNLYERLFKANVISAYLQILSIQLENFGRKSRSATQDGKMIRILLDTISRTEQVLSDPDMAWVGKEFSDLGAPFLRILAAIGESKLLGPDLRIRSEKVGEVDFRELRNDLKRIRTSLTGPLLFWEDGEIRLAFSQGVIDLRNDLQGLLSQEFMILEPTERETIRIPPGTRLLWDIKFLEDAGKGVEPYETFIRHGLKSFPTDLRNTIKNTAQNTFGLNMLQLIARAQNLRPVSSRFTYRPTEADVRLEIENFKEASKHLDRLLLAFERLGLVESYLDLVHIVNWQASTLLEAVDKLFSAEAFYSVKGGDLSWWDGKEPLGLASFDVNDEEELKYYLELQRERIKYLAYQYAEPILTFFMNRAIPKDRTSARTFSKWERILSALDKFESKKPKNPVTVLERFVLFEMNKIKSDNYFEKVSEKDLTFRSGDYFLEVRSHLMQMLYDQCQFLTAKKVMKEYADIGALFNQTLAGKFPFSSLDILKDQIEAEPDKVRNFYRLVDRYPKLDEQIRQIERFFGTSGGRAIEFLNQMEKIRRFFSPFLGSGEKETGKEKDPLFDFSLEFRVNRKYEIGGNQIIEWKMTVAGQEFRFPGEKDKDMGRWRFGDPIHLSFRWAKDSPDYPIKGPDLPGLKVEDRMVLY